MAQPIPEILEPMKNKCFRRWLENAGVWQHPNRTWKWNQDAEKRPQHWPFLCPKNGCNGSLPGAKLLDPFLLPKVADFPSQFPKERDWLSPEVKSSHHHIKYTPCGPQKSRDPIQNLGFSVGCCIYFLGRDYKQIECPETGAEVGNGSMFIFDQHPMDFKAFHNDRWRESIAEVIVCAISAGSESLEQSRKVLDFFSLGEEAPTDGYLLFLSPHTITPFNG